MEDGYGWMMDGWRMEMDRRKEDEDGGWIDGRKMDMEDGYGWLKDGWMDGR